MTPEQWSRVQTLFDAVVNLDPAERGRFVEDACRDDDELRAEVMSLIAAHDRSADFIERPAYEAAAELLAGEDDQPLDGRTIGPYLIRQEIGRGGMGIVYLADDTRLSRRVALKTLAPDASGDPRSRARIGQEARAAAALSHPGIATVFALEEIDDALYLASEYVAGPTLRRLIDAGPLPIPTVVDIALQIGRALAAAHAQGVVHRDLKPENIVRTAAGTVKVLDFGIARIEGLTPARLTGTGDAVGTPGYMAPEQIRGQAVDFRADLFSLGVLVYEMASGSNPFEAGTRMATAARVLEVTPAPLSQASKAGGPALDRIVSTCLSKSPADRYGSTLELVSDLERLHAGMPAPVARTDAASASRGWWEAHQAIASAIDVLMMYPVWRVRAWLPSPWGTLFLLAALAFAATATTWRLHMWFTFRHAPAECGDVRARASRWTRLCDLGLAAALVAAALGIADPHPAVAMLLVAVAIATSVASLVIEPTTTKAAFGPPA